MADKFTKKKRSEIMSKVKAKNTKPEILVRKFLFSRGFRFRIHSKTLAGKPDIVLKKYSTVIFVNGCLWHGHKVCNHNFPKSRLDYWVPKIEKNISNDLKNFNELKKSGWNVLVIWECELKSKIIDSTLSAVEDKILNN